MIHKLLIVLLFVGSSGCVSKKDFKTIVLKTTGYVEVEPDEANILVTISCTDKNIVKAKDCLLNMTIELNTTLAKFKINENDILTTRVDLNKEFIWENNSQVFNGYRASNSTTVKIRELKVLEELYPELLINPKYSIGSLTYGHSKLDSLNEVAYLKALENAERLADKLLLSLPENNKIITQISNTEIEQTDVNYKKEFKLLAFENEIDKSKLPISTGNMLVAQQLFVEFRIY